MSVTHDVDESPRSPGSSGAAGPAARAAPAGAAPTASLPVVGPTRSMIPVLASLSRPQRAGWLTSLQRQAGNRSVLRLLSPDGASPVQRACAGPGSCGCASCSDEPERDPDAVSRTATVQRQTKVQPTASVQRQANVQRQTNVQRQFTDGTPENPVATLPPGSPYAGMDSGLLDMLGRTLTGKTFWHWVNVKPKNLGEALDNLAAPEVNTLVQLKRRLDMHGLWGNIQTMKTVWTTSSLGMDYNGTAMEGALDANPQFCKDTSIGEAMHSGTCWREMVDPAGTPGLHYCTPNSIHIDPHQVTRKGWTQGGVQVGGGSIVSYRGNYCLYAMDVWLTHMSDVVGGEPVNVFHQHRQLGEQITRQKGRVDWLGPRNEEARRQGPVLDGLEGRRTALSGTLRAWSIRGFEGDASAEAQQVIQELKAIESELARVRTTLDGAEASEVPDPTIIYGQ